MNYNTIPVCALVLLTMLSACSDNRQDSGQSGSERFAIQVSREGAGTGTVVSAPSGVSCGADCTEEYPAGTVLTLRASASSGSEFLGWSGACAGGDACVVTMDAAKSVTASFGLLPDTLIVAKAGTGSGTVTTAPAGIHCGTDCEETYSRGTEVTLTASADGNSVFAGWSGSGCSGTGDCIVTIDAAKSVTANFTLLPHTLSVIKAGTGTGIVTTAHAGINCGADCEEAYSPGTEVTLTASADGNSVFAEWSGGGCSGVGTCVVMMSGPTTITATFDVVPQIETHSVGGSVAGLAGTLVLQINGINNSSISNNGSFTFSDPIEAGAAYIVTVLAQPATQTCTVNNGSGIMGSADVTDVAVMCTDDPTTLSASVSTLALAVYCPASSGCAVSRHDALTGSPRVITITNTGTNPAINTSAVSAGLPADTLISSTACSGALAPGNSCTITITPGSSASSSCSIGIVPTPGTITVSADNANTLVSNVLVLSHGCQYQGGFVYSIDDTTPNTGSIGGKVVSLVDQAAPNIGSGPQATSAIWSANGNGSDATNVSFDVIPLVADTGLNDTYDIARATFGGDYANTGTFPFPPSSVFAACDGVLDGACNTGNIVAFYDSYRTGYGVGAAPYTLSPGPTPASHYAAGMCTATINGYTDWYLPAVCEIGAASGMCPVQGQSISGQLSVLLGDQNAATPSTSCFPPAGTDCLAGIYWSSTQHALSPQYFAWSTLIQAGGVTEINVSKAMSLGVRCSREMTH